MLILATILLLTSLAISYFLLFSAIKWYRRCAIMCAMIGERPDNFTKEEWYELAKKAKIGKVHSTFNLFFSDELEDKINGI